MDNETLTTNSVDTEDAILPEDYEEGKEYSIEEGGVDTDSDLPETESDPTELSNESSASEEGAPEADPPAEQEGAPANPAEKPEEPVRDSYKFTDTFQGMSREVEVKMQDIPDMYRKAQTADYVTRKIMTAERNARSLGYEGIDDMLTKVRSSLMEAEVNALLDDNVHETVAKDLVNRKYAPLQAMIPPQQRPMPSAQPAQQTRNLVGELNELYAAHPAMRGQNLPEPVAKASLGGKSLLSAYNEYLAQHNAAEVQRLTKENAILRQNSASAEKAPVKGVSGSGATDTKSKDPWDVGFDSAY